MPRPEFVTEKDIERWTEILNKDETLTAVLIQFPVVKEVCYAGFWLCEELVKLRCPQSLITRIQYTAGMMSHGHDPWTIHQSIIEDYKNNKLDFDSDFSVDCTN